MVGGWWRLGWRQVVEVEVVVVCVCVCAREGA